MSAGRFFLDTNVFVYSFDETAPSKQKIASDLIQDGVNKRIGATSYQVVQEFYNVAINRFATPMSPAEAQLYFSNVFRPLFAVNFSPALMFEAFRIREGYRLSWYDSIVFASAIESDCPILYSEDFQNGMVVESTRVRNPFRA